MVQSHKLTYRPTTWIVKIGNRWTILSLCWQWLYLCHQQCWCDCWHYIRPVRLHDMRAHHAVRLHHSLKTIGKGFIESE